MYYPSACTHVLTEQNEIKSVLKQIFFLSGLPCLIIYSSSCVTSFSVSQQIKWMLNAVSHYLFKQGLRHEMKAYYVGFDGSSKHTLTLLMRKQAWAGVLARALHVMNSLVAYTLQQEIQHVCQGYLGKSHSLVCGSVAFYYLPQSFKSNSISSLLPGPSSVSAERTLDRRWSSLMDGTAIACRWL